MLLLPGYIDWLNSPWWSTSVGYLPPFIPLSLFPGVYLFLLLTLPILNYIFNMEYFLKICLTYFTGLVRSGIMIHNDLKVYVENSYALKLYTQWDFINIFYVAQLKICTIKFCIKLKSIEHIPFTQFLTWIDWSLIQWWTLPTEHWALSPVFELKMGP